jgi:hypothetical protein
MHKCDVVYNAVLNMQQCTNCTMFLLYNPALILIDSFYILSFKFVVLTAITLQKAVLIINCSPESI